MEVRNCRGCRRLFNYMSGPPLCPACISELEEKFARVKEYIYDNPKATLHEIATENEVSKRQIEQWVREERLYFSEDSAYGIGCEKCGKMIKTGRFCHECKGKMANTLQSALKKPIVAVQDTKGMRDRDKMRFLDNE